MNHHGFVWALPWRTCVRGSNSRISRYPCRRLTHTDARQHRGNIWIPTVNVHKQDPNQDATQLLIRAGFLRQAYAGIFHMLPLGLRVQEKLERLIDKHMSTIGASKVSLSSISSQKLWQRSGRLKLGSEFFLFEDRKDGKWLLAPTHEEEITTLLAEVVKTQNDLPVRLYQISRKYRDEKRPRGGLLRGREFIMKDLYTFDKNVDGATSTYDQIRKAYRNFLDELNVNYIEARADSGNMGGNLSHEYHFPSQAGEDNLIVCSDCGYARNEEFVSPVKVHHRKVEMSPQSLIDTEFEPGSFVVQDVSSKDGRQLVRALAPKTTSTISQNSESLNYFAIKAAFDDHLQLDTGIEDPLNFFYETLEQKPINRDSKSFGIYYLVDDKITDKQAFSFIKKDIKQFASQDIAIWLVSRAEDSSSSLDLLKLQTGNPCPSCNVGKLRITKAIEVGHTFHLGRRYSSKLGLAIRAATQGSQATELVPVEMGCHGIGVSRLIAAVASCLSDEKGLNWPRIIAPFEVAILVNQTDAARTSAAEQLYDKLVYGHGPEDTIDVLIDDRKDQSLGWKLKDADVIGYPVLIVVGKAFEKNLAEVQCRRLGTKEEVNIEEVPAYVRKLLEKL